MRESARISTVLKYYFRPNTNAFKQRSSPLAGVEGKWGVCYLAVVMLFAIASPITYGDTVISTEEIEILEAGEFEDSSEWEFSSSRGFTQNRAEYTMGMVADEEMSFTHSRPDNFQDFTSWASTGCSECNATLGEADGVYSWSTGPDITMSGYDYDGLGSREIENVSLVLHFSIPDPLNNDEVNVLLQNHGSDILLTTYARTLNPVNRMSNPLIIPLDGYVEWSWSKLESTQFTVDYVSDNQGLDDSEVRVDAVGLKVKYHQPWYSFENSRAEHEVSLYNVPVIDFSIYEGAVSGLSYSSCGLTPSGDSVGEWVFFVEVPPSQKLGRVHTYGAGNHTIWSKSDILGDEYVEVESGELLDQAEDDHWIRIIIEDGCLSGARVDVNDPRLVVSGRVSGGVSGLSSASSQILFAVGDFLVHSEIIDSGQFSFSIPVGHALPTNGGLLEVGVATRFQWSSNGTAETTVVHIWSMSITGGFGVDWDRDPSCDEVGIVGLIEDEGGRLISFSSLCDDDITDSEDLVVTALSSNSSLIRASVEGASLAIEPLPNANGVASVSVSVFDESGNSWEGDILVTIDPVPDSPEILSIPSSLYIELGDTIEINPIITDPDSDLLTVTASRSWASIVQNGSISLTPVEPGTHTLSITVSDGISEVSRNIEVIVTAKPDLVVEDIEIRLDGLEGESLSHGDIVEIVGFIRNQGRGSAENSTFYCSVDGVLVGTGSIGVLRPGDLKMSVCDVQLIDSGKIVTFSVEIDGTNSIEESEEGNNLLSILTEVKGAEEGVERGENGNVVIIISIMAILVSVAAFHIGPAAVKKDFRRRK